MEFNIKHQEEYNRVELLLRTFFGFLYILIPHGIMLGIYGIVGFVYMIIAWFTVLFTGKFPDNYFQYILGLQRWRMRVAARLLNLADGYPAFGINAEDDAVTLEATNPESLSVVDLLLKSFFGGLMILPHAICLYVWLIVVNIFTFLGFWMILITGKYPEGWHSFVVTVLRWGVRLQLYFGFMSDKYPPFSGKTDAELGLK